MLHVMIGAMGIVAEMSNGESVNGEEKGNSTGNEEGGDNGNVVETMPDTTTPGDQLEAKPEVTAQSSGSDMDHSTTHLQNKGSL